MALELSFAERRVLGVLIEKGCTTPDQYPLTLNALVAGCNQKSCRDPVSDLGEDSVLDALESLRSKGLVTLVRSVGSRTDRYKHRTGETLEVDAKEAAVLAELFLRGPQTDGELRQRASRMSSLDDLTAVSSVIERLRSRPESYVRRLSPEGRRRGVKYAHTFYPPAEEPALESDTMDGGYERRRDVEPSRPVPSAASREPVLPVSTAAAAVATAPPLPSSEAHTGSAGGSGAAEVAALRQEIERLKERVEELESTFARFFR